MRGDHSAEREADDIYGCCRLDQLAQSRGDDLCDARVILSWRERRFAIARKIQRPDGALSRQGVDVTDPVRPGAMRAMCQYQRRTVSPGSPDQRADAARGLNSTCAALEIGHHQGWIIHA